MEPYLRRSNSVGKRSRDTPSVSTDWEIPKRSARPAETNSSVPVNTTNRFSTLAADKNSSEYLTRRLQDATTARKNSDRSPPIIIESKKEWTHEFIKTLISRYNQNYHLQYRGNNKVAVICYSSDSHEAVKKGLSSENVPYHTFSRKDERTSKAVIFGLPAYVESSLKDELASLGFADVIVRKMKVPQGRNVACPPFFVQLPPGSDMKRFKQIKYISNCVVQIRKYQANNIYGTQCFRCQGFGHSSKNCNLKPRCVKCTEPHLTADCPKKDRSQQAQCCNCGENHPANYRQCSERQKYLRFNQEKRIQNQASKIPTKITLSGKVDGRSWNTVAAGNNNPIKVTCSQLSNDINDQATMDMLAILKAIKSIKNEFVECKNMMDKVILILTHLGQYV